MAWKARNTARCKVCQEVFLPQGPRHATCDKTTCKMARDKMQTAARAEATRGRICRYCSRSSDGRGFALKDACKTCYTAIQKYGPCTVCSGRLRKVRCRKLLSCERCEAEGVTPLVKIRGADGSVYQVRQLGPSEDTEQVRTYCGRSAHRFFAAKDAVVPFPEGELTVAEIIERVGSVHIVQSPERFDTLALTGVRSVRGISRPSFPRDLPFVSNKSFNLFYELAHYTRLGECDVVSFAWWANKFKPDIELESAARAWDRFKSLLRGTGVGITLGPGKAFRFDAPGEFVAGVMDACSGDQDETNEAWT